MANVKKDASVKKRQQIDHTGRIMFAWVAGASVLVGFALVIGGFLVQRIMFESKVLGVKTNTVSTLDKNIAAYDSLRDNIRVLNTNAALSSVKLNDQEEPLRVVLDALPADNNSLALGASIQSLVSRTSGVTLDSFQATSDDATVASNGSASSDSTSSTTTSDGSTTTSDTQSSDSAQQIPFTMELSSTSADSLREVMKNFEKSIRAIDIDESTVDASDSKITMSITGHAYYLPSKTIQLTQKEVKP